MLEQFIELSEFKKISPTKCRVKVEDDLPEICICHENKIKDKKVYKIKFYNTVCIVIKINKKYYMIEESLIKEMKINIGELYDNIKSV